MLGQQQLSSSSKPRQNRFQLEQSSSKELKLTLCLESHSLSSSQNLHCNNTRLFKPLQFRCQIIQRERLLLIVFPFFLLKARKVETQVPKIPLEKLFLCMFFWAIKIPGTMHTLPQMRRGSAWNYAKQFQH
jgi:hypothetical protein